MRRARHSGAVGLGLPIAKAIVEADGGTLAVAGSRRGCTFEARLPTRRA
jgi:signal transduction histidine kinase